MPQPGCSDPPSGSGAPGLLSARGRAATSPEPTLCPACPSSGPCSRAGVSLLQGHLLPLGWFARSWSLWDSALPWGHFQQIPAPAQTAGHKLPSWPALPARANVTHLPHWAAMQSVGETEAHTGFINMPDNSHFVRALPSWGVDAGRAGHRKAAGIPRSCPRSVCAARAGGWF